MANLPAPQADDLGPAAVLASAGTPVIVAAGLALTAPADVISPAYGAQIAPGSMSFG